MKQLQLAALLMGLTQLPAAALQFDLPRVCLGEQTSLNDLSATLSFYVDGVPQPPLPCQLIAGPDGDPPRYHLVFDMIETCFCPSPPCPVVDHLQLSVTVCGNSAGWSPGDTLDACSLTLPLELPADFGPGGQPFPDCLPQAICSVTSNPLVIHVFEQTPGWYVGTGTFSITNLGEAGSVLTGTVANGCGGFWLPFEHDYSLQAGASASFFVSYDGNSNSQCSLDTGADCPVLLCIAYELPSPPPTWTPDSLSFGTVHSTGLDDYILTFTISNPYPGPIFGPLSMTMGADYFAIEWWGGGWFYLEGGDSASIAVHFFPHQSGIFTGNINMGPGSNLPLTGSCVLIPLVDAWPLSLDFGTALAGSLADRSLTLRGGSVLPVSGTVVSTDSAFVVVSGADYQLDYNEEQQVIVQYLSADAGLHTGLLVVGNDCLDISLTGRSVQPEFVTGPHSACGEVADSSELLADWNDHLVGLDFSGSPAGLTVTIVANGVQVGTSPATSHWRGRDHLDLQPLLPTLETLWLEVNDNTSTWNDNGVACTWSFDNVGTASPALPTAFSLTGPRPNPFNPETRLEVTLPVADQLRLAVVDLRGRELARLFDGPLPAGAHSFTWRPEGLASGTYLIVATCNQHQKVRRALLLK